MLNNVKTVIIFYGFLSLIQILEAGIDFHTFMIKPDDLMFQNLNKLGREYSKCNCDVESHNCYEFTIIVNRYADNCTVYGFLRSENSTIPNQTIDVNTSLKYKLDSADVEPDEEGKSKKIAIITISTLGAVGATGIAGYFLADQIKTLLQSNTYRM